MSGGGCTETVLANYINNWVNLINQSINQLTKLLCLQSNIVSDAILSEVNTDKSMNAHY